MTGNVLILGAKSGIARALSEEFARAGYGLVLAARDAAVLEGQVLDLKLRYGVEARALPFDAADMEGHPAFFERVLAEAGEIEGAVLAVGWMGDEATSWSDPLATKAVIDTNLTGCITAMLPIADYLEKRGTGFLAAISSVAGDRGRKKNVTYGAAKAGLTVYMQGLVQRFAKTGVKVTVIKPGFVDTRMTYGLGKLPLIVPPEKAAADIFKAIRKGKAEVYTPWIWRWIMLAVRNVPTFIFKKMKF